MIYGLVTEIMENHTFHVKYPSPSFTEKPYQDNYPQDNCPCPRTITPQDNSLPKANSPQTIAPMTILLRLSPSTVPPDNCPQGQSPLPKQLPPRTIPSTRPIPPGQLPPKTISPHPDYCSGQPQSHGYSCRLRTGCHECAAGCFSRC